MKNTDQKNRMHYGYFLLMRAYADSTKNAKAIDLQDLDTMMHIF